jgi:hypothetical protein
MTARSCTDCDDGGVTPIPDFITHYHLADRRAFLNLSDLDEAALASVLSGLETTAASGVSERRFGPRYMPLRRATEELLRTRFIERGGRPTRRSPHYFVLGESAWFRGLYRVAAEVRVRLSDLPTEQVSVTYPDSITSMGLLAEFGIKVSPRAYHGNVYRIEEIPVLVERHGLLHATKPDTYKGHQFDDFEHYVEVQVWSDDVLDNVTR